MVSFKVGIIILVTVCSVITEVKSVLCYQCVSSQPGCGTPFDWRWHTPKSCLKCVKIVERKGSSEVITRNCLEVLQSTRRDVPADQYEGCRPAIMDPKLAHYVNHSIQENDVRRTFYDQTTWCFCEFDHWCNSATSFKSSLWLPSAIFALCLMRVLL